MDTWNEKQKELMRLGGNEEFKKFAVEQGIDEMKISDKYNTVAAEWYRNMLKCKYDGGENMPVLPLKGTGKNLVNGNKNTSNILKNKSVSNSNTTSTNKSFQGIGGNANSQSNQNQHQSSYGLSYQQNSSQNTSSNTYSKNNTFQYNQPPYPGRDLKTGDQDFLQSFNQQATSFFENFSKNAQVLASKAEITLNETKSKAKDEGWFDFDNLQEQAGVWAEKAKIAAENAKTALNESLNESGFDTSKNNNNYITHTDSNSSNNSYGRNYSQQGTSSNSYKPIGISSENYNFQASGHSNNPQPVSNTQEVQKQKPLIFRTKSPERKLKIDSEIPSMSGSGSLFDGSKIGSKSISEKKPVDVWDSNAWFDEM